MAVRGRQVRILKDTLAEFNAAIELEGWSRDRGLQFWKQSDFVAEAFEELFSLRTASIAKTIIAHNSSPLPRDITAYTVILVPTGTFETYLSPKKLRPIWDKIDPRKIYGARSRAAVTKTALMRYADALKRAHGKGGATAA